MKLDKTINYHAASQDYINKRVLLTVRYEIYIVVLGF